MQKPHKDLLRGLVNTLRQTLAGAAASTSISRGDLARGDLDRELERLGFAADGTTIALDALPNPSAADVRAYRVAEAQLNSLPRAGRVEARNALLERAAYSWINRLLALRALEARGLIEETVRANPDYEGISEALFILRATQPARTKGPDGGWWAVIEDACRTQTQLLPGLFDLNDPNASLRPSVTALLTCLKALGAPQLDPVLADPDAIGWAYQFYQEEAKARVYAKLGSGGKVENRAEIAAATQLFTEPYMVAWLLQNSLGRSYAEAYPATRLTATWEYYIDPAKVNPEPPAEPATRPHFTLDELTVLDPCMGSGHFLRAAFDLLFAMYQEQHADWPAATIANRILERHLYGIDIDPRAAQLAALTLVLRAWERVQQAESGSSAYVPPQLNLATTPQMPAGALDRHLARYADDAIYRPVLAKLFEALEQAPLLGSLLRPEEHLDAAIDALMTPNKRWQPALLSEDVAQQAALTGIQSEERSALKARLLERLGASFVKEAADADVSAQLLGREASEGVQLVQLLSRKYAVVATNPPYLGSGYFDVQLSNIVANDYGPGKNDLYAAFILRGFELCEPHGVVAIVTMNKWMYQNAYKSLREGSSGYEGILRMSEIGPICDLGSRAFSPDIGLHDGVQVALFTFRNRTPAPAHKMAIFRLVGDDFRQKQSTLASNRLHQRLYTPLQHLFLSINSAPICYWLPHRFLDILRDGTNLGSVVRASGGIGTRDESRFIRRFWEIQTEGRRWISYAKGGGYQKWLGLIDNVVDWQDSGVRVKSSIVKKYPYLNGNYGFLIRDEELQCTDGLTYSDFYAGSFSCRVLQRAVCSDGGPGLYAASKHHHGIAAWLNSRVFTYLLRSISPSINHCRWTYVIQLPLPPAEHLASISPLAKAAIILKARLLQQHLADLDFLEIPKLEDYDRACASTLHTVEAYAEHIFCAAFEVTQVEVLQLLSDTGTPAGWHPLIVGCDAMPPLPAELGLQPLPQAFLDYFSKHDRIQSTANEFARIKSHLRDLYEAGPGAKIEGVDGATEVSGDESGSDDDDGTDAGAYVPIPTETFLEELSVKLQIHPISVYWLLEELRAEGARCLPEERRLLEDRLTVIVLRLMGHRWPKQIEAGEAVPTWADTDGVIPLTSGSGEATLADRVRLRLRAEEGDLGAQQTEALLQELTGRDLAEWLRRDFFTRHQRQFKKRPIAWHLRSTPQGRGKRSSALPAFECMVYYHATDSDILARIRTHYVEPLIQAERSRQNQARQGSLPGVAPTAKETIEAEATLRIRELEEFAAQLRQVEEQGFACAELEKLITNEPLDRWSGDGYTPPASTGDLLTQEAAWRVDINDGVRVNIAPLQGAGLLASDVLAKKDLTKAVADRARWRSDERRWVRAGKLPRCGWLDERVPESPAWTEQAPQREAERQRLEEKRKKVLAELGAEASTSN